MSSFKRFVDIARAEVGALREKVSERVTGTRKLDEFSDDELVAEIEKRRLQKQLRDEAEANAAAGSARAAKAAGAERPSAEEPPAPRRRTAAPAPSSVDRYYANLEVEPGSDLETVKRAYRRLMRKYHPDKHADDPQKHKAATELAQNLTRAYMELKKHLEGAG